jgi:hypothetical protein
MTAPDHVVEPFKNFLRDRGHPYMSFQLCALSAISGLRRQQQEQRQQEQRPVDPTQHNNSTEF